MKNMGLVKKKHVTIIILTKGKNGTREGIKKRKIITCQS